MLRCFCVSSLHGRNKPEFVGCGEDQQQPYKEHFEQQCPPVAGEQEALARNGYRRAQTAQELGMTTRTLYNKIKKFGLQS